MAIKQDTKKFTDEEIQDLRSLQVQIGGLTTRFGQLHIAKLKMKEEENKLMKSLSELEKKERLLAEKLSSKYGKGNLDIETGEFTPSPKE